MISPTFLTVLYYFHLVGTILVSLWFIFKGLGTHYGGMMVMGGLANLLIAPFLVRLFYEFIIILFKIHSRLVSIDTKTAHASVMATTPAPQAATPVVPTTSSAVEAVVPQDTWNPETGEMNFTTPDFSNLSLGNFKVSSTERGQAVPAVNFGSLLQQMPNWPVVLASVLVVFSTFGSYASAQWI